MRRRDFIKAITVTVSGTWPIAARAQQRERLRRVAILMGTTRDTPGVQDRETAFCKKWTRRPGKAGNRI
jgi:hypothetical protein